MEINERIKSNVTGRTYTVTWVSDKVTMAEVGFAKTESEGESFFIKRLLNARYAIPKEGKKLTDAAIERNKKADIKYSIYSDLYNSILNGCGETGACVPIIDYFREGPFYYTIYRKINASSLTLDQIASLPDIDKYRLLLRLVQGLQPMHTLGVIHGDLKPENILVQKDGESWRIRLIDMNDCYRSGHPNEPGAVVGTPDYYSPELTKYNTYEIEDWEDEDEMRKVKNMADALTPRSDIFALGIIFHEFFTGKRPRITDEDIKYLCEAAIAHRIEVSDSIPEDLRDLIISMLDSDYLRRPTLNQVGETLRAKMVGSHVTDPTFSVVHLRDDIYRVEILNDSPDAEIYYTVDGTAPLKKDGTLSVTALKYKDGLELKKYTTVKAICIKGKRKSNTVSQSAWVKGQPFTKSKAPTIVVHDRNVTIRLDERSPKASVIYYTMDGSKPSKISLVYTGPFDVDKGVELVQAMVLEPGPHVSPSEIKQAKIYNKIKKVSPPEIKKVLYKNAFNIISANGDDVFYTLDGSTPTETSIKYTGEFTVADIDSFQIKAVCIVDGVRSEIVELNKFKSSVKIKFKPK